MTDALIDRLAGIEPRLKDEPAAYKRACIRLGLEARADLDREAIRREAFEEAAKVAEAHPMRFAGQTEDAVRDELAAAIRALSEKG